MHVVKGHDVIVVGTSAGGLDALDKLIGSISADIPAAIFIVQHMAPGGSGSGLLYRLDKYKNFRCKLAEDGETFEAGRIYLAPPDKHLLVRKTTVEVVRGARENRHRPAIDPLFRTAAVEHSNRVIGVLLTGMLDDGTAGIIAIKKCGGVTIVQDPKDARYPDMPQNALNSKMIDFSVPISEMGSLIERIAHEIPPEDASIPRDIRVEAEIAERVVSTIEQLDTLGTKAPYSCPNCGGVLWRINDPDVERFRCHTGHAYTAKSLLEGQSEKIEETLWVSLRAFQEKKNLLEGLQQEQQGRIDIYEERIHDVDVHINRIKDLLGINGND